MQASARTRVSLEKLNPCYDETRKLLNFTRQERYVVYFLAITLGIGAILKLVRNQQLAEDLVPTRFYDEEQQFNDISTQINDGDIVLIDSTHTANGQVDLDVPGDPKLSIAADMKINLNTAELDELVELPGIGPVLAQRIRAFTDLNGPFKNKSDIVLVKGIGEKIYTQIQGLVTTD